MSENVQMELVRNLVPIITAIGVIVIGVWGIPKLNGMAKTAEKTHTLVNSGYQAQLEIAAIALRRLAAITNEPEDALAAVKAEKLLQDHIGRQKIVDANDPQFGRD